MKKETLEEAAERLIFKTIGGTYGIMSSDENDQVDGYYKTYEEAYLTLKLNWQAKRMYSEEEVFNIAQQLRLQLKSGVLKWQDDFEFDLTEWFKQLKK